MGGGLLGGLLGSSPNRGGARGSARPRDGEQTLGGLLGGLLGSSPDKVEVTSSRRLQFQDPTEDLWMIGGVFLEHFVTIFDFDEGRIGFAEPAGGVPPLVPSRLNAVQPPNDGAVREALAGANHSPAIPSICAMAAVASCAMLLGLALRMRSRSILPGSGGKFQRSGYREASIEDGELGENIE